MPLQLIVIEGHNSSKVIKLEILVILKAGMEHFETIDFVLLKVQTTFKKTYLKKFTNLMCLKILQVPFKVKMSCFLGLFFTFYPSLYDVYTKDDMKWHYI